MYFLQQLRKHGLPQELLIQFYTALIEFTLHASITVWFQAATKQDKNRLQWTVRTAEEISEASLSSLHNWFTFRHWRVPLLSGRNRIVRHRSHFNLVAFLTISITIYLAWQVQTVPNLEMLSLYPTIFANWCCTALSFYCIFLFRNF